VAAANTLDSKASLAYIEKAAANDAQYSILMLHNQQAFVNVFSVDAGQ
jgi:hypothetical protein